MPAHIDEGLLGKLVVKYRLDMEQNPAHRSRLWFKLTKEYNKITGNNFPKSKMTKKWQNVEFRNRQKKLSKLDVPPKAEERLSDSLETRPYKDNLWSVMDHVLRDLFLYLVIKYGMDDISHPRVKSKAWQDLTSEFHALIGNCIVIKPEKFPKKWQNWKAYNKSRGIMAPVEQCKDRLDFDVIRAKLLRLRDRLKTDKDFAANLSQESDFLMPIDDVEIPVSFNEELIDLEQTVSSNDGSKTSKILDKQIALKRLKSETERHKIIVETGMLEQRKIQLEIDLVNTQLEQAKIELALKRKELENLGLAIQ